MQMRVKIANVMEGIIWQIINNVAKLIVVCLIYIYILSAYYHASSWF